jgi:hypothetical protein
MSDQLLPVPKERAARAFVDCAMYPGMYKVSVADREGSWREDARAIGKKFRKLADD